MQSTKSLPSQAPNLIDGLTWRLLDGHNSGKIKTGVFWRKNAIAECALAHQPAHSPALVLQFPWQPRSIKFSPTISRQMNNDHRCQNRGKPVCFGEVVQEYRRSPVFLDTGYISVMWSETVGLRTKPVWDQKISLVLSLGLAHCGLGLGLADLILCCETRSSHARRHNDLEGHSNFSSTIYSFSLFCAWNSSTVENWRSTVAFT